MSLLEDRNARYFLNFLRDGLPYVAEVFYETEAGLRKAVEDGFSRASMGRIGVCCPAMGEGHTEVNEDVGDTGRVTITEAATLLGVHPNTVRGRVKAGIYDTEKVATEHGFTWMIDPNSLVTSPYQELHKTHPNTLLTPPTPRVLHLWSSYRTC